MNKPIRTISLFCMLLFIALMANATYLQYWQADALNKDSRNRSSGRWSPTTRPRW